MANSNKLYFQFAVENVRKTLDAQKGEIEKWAKDNPILLEVRFKNLKSQLEQIRSIFGDNSQLTSLGNQIDSTFENARKGARRMRQSVDETSEAMQRLNKASSHEIGIREQFNANASAIARTKKEIEELNREIETHKSLIAKGVTVGGDGNILKDSLAIKQRKLAELEQKLTGLQSRRIELEQKLSAATQDRVKAQKDATSAQTQAEREMASTINSTTVALSNQSQILSELKTMAMRYLSVWGAKTFIDNIIEQGGQLEQQRLSIGAILQDTAHANELFGKIKSLAIVSPFGVTELDAMTKQLSAYGFKYNELYDMTKRLADISAATGTEVSRLALALGHVRAEGALSGYTLRQFSMGNIPLLEKLSAKIGVTAKEIRKMVSKKEIGYDQVLEVMKELTDEGGMFYNAQETMSQALNAKFKNLRDSFQIMYSEMAEGAPGNFLKGIAETLTTLSKNWRILMPMIAAGVGALGMQKAVTMALNHELAKEGLLTDKAAVSKSKYTAATQAAIMATGRWTLALRGAGRALMSLGRFLISPWTLGFAAVEGLIYLWQKHNQEVEKAKELTNSFKLTSSEGERNLTERITGIDPYKEGMSESELKQGIDSMTQTLKDYGKGLNVAKTLQETFGSDEATGKVKSLAEQYEFLREKIENTIDVYKELQRTADAFEFGINYSSSWWGDENVETDLTDYANAVKKFEDEVSKYVAKHKDSLDGMIAKAKEADGEFAKAVSNMKSYSDILRTLWEDPAKFADANKVANMFFAYAEGGGHVPSSYLNIIEQRKEAMRELDSFIEGTEARLKNEGYKFDSLDQKQIDNLMKQTHDWIDRHPEWSSIIDDIKEKIEVQWPIKLEPETEDTPKELNDWQKQMQDWLDKHGSKLKIRPDMSRDDIVKLVHQSIKDTQDVIDQTKPILLRFGVDLSNIPEELPVGLRTPWGKKQAADYPVAAKENKTDKEFIKEFGLPSPKEKGSGRKEDKALKEAKTRLEETKSFLSEYKKYREAYGRDRAVNILEDLFQTTKGKGQQIVDNFKQILTEIKGSIKLNTDDRKKFGISVDKLIADTNLSEAKEKIDRQMKQMEGIISESAESFDLYKKLFEKTGDKEFAMSAFSNGQMWDDAAESLAQSLREKMGGEAVIDWDADEQTAEDWFKKNYENGGELFKLWKEIVSLISKNYKQALSDGADAISRQLTVAEKIKKVEAEIEELRRKRASSTDMNTQVSLDRQIHDKTTELSQLHSESFKESLDYLRFFGASLNMANDEVQRIGTTIKAQLSKELSDGTITASDYSRTLKEVNKRMEESRNAFKGDFMTFLTKGQKGLVEKRQAAVDDAAIKVAQAEKERQEAMAKGDKEAAAAAEARRKAAEKEKKEAIEALGLSERQYDTLNGMLGVLNIAQGALEGMQKAAESLAEMFDALGNENSANTWSDIADGIKAVSSALAPANGLLQNAMNGNVSGLVSSAISSPVQMITGPITALAQLHDKKRERQIEDLRRDVQKIDNTLNLIKSLRENTLGYDNGNLRRQMAQYYRSQYTSRNIDTLAGIITVNSSPSAAAMYEYYSRGGLGGNGYQQELDALKKQREDYQKMYDAENEKKKSSKESLEEYKQAMAELDITIQNYAKNIANELYDIDLKGWADQIGDALMTAFENGEDAAEAFNDTVQDIMRQVLRKMLSLGIIQKPMERLQKKLFGENGEGGSFDATNPEGTIDAAMRDVAEFFGENGEGQKMIAATQTFYGKWEDFMQSKGLTLEDTGSSSSSGRSIKGITEQTWDLGLSYWNAMRADLSVNRAMVAEYYPQFLSAVTRGNASLANIENHTAAIMRSNDSVMKSNAEILSIFKRVTQGGDKVRVA